MFLRLVLFLGAALMLAGAAQADVPQMINYQGVLTSGGSPVTTEVSVIFAIWNDPTDGDSLWSEQQTVTPDNRGLFNVLLGAVTPIPDSALAGDAYLGMTIELQPEMEPRILFTSVPYSYRSSVCDSDNSNWTVIDSVLYTNDYWGIARGNAGNVLDGQTFTMVNLGVECTIGMPGWNQKNQTISGGYGNKAGFSESTVGGGLANIAEGVGSTVGGGYTNMALDGVATIGGGQRNRILAYGGTIAGGSFNHVTDSFSVIGGGNKNDVNGKYSAVLGGATTEFMDNTPP